MKTVVKTMIGNNTTLVNSYDGVAPLSSRKNDPSVEDLCLEKKLFIMENSEICQEEFRIFVFLN